MAKEPGGARRVPAVLVFLANNPWASEYRKVFAPIAMRQLSL
jgi:hypothetical protein